jgi:hypothetical protein
MGMTNEQAIEILRNDIEICTVEQEEACKMAIKALEEMDRFKFEISECKAILDNPTPDVTENDKKRAMYVLQTFPDMRELPEQTFGCAED